MKIIKRLPLAFCLLFFIGIENLSWEIGKLVDRLHSWAYNKSREIEQN
jgi:hypothetical protein